jgi:predicted membrane-bound spermidine synthase
MVRVPRGALYGAFLLSGVTALIYQVLWSRYLTLLVGGTSVAHTIVLATFMGGLAFGNAFFGRRADAAGAHRLRLYALLEVGIGLTCLLFPTFFDSVSRAYLALARVSGPGAAVNDVLKVLLAAASMFVPCVFMGGTLPVLARYVVDRMSGFGVRLGFLYFINTAGAVVGCVLGGFYVVEHWGLELGMVVAALANLAIGGLFYVWSKRPASAPMPDAVEPEAAAAEAPAGPDYTAGQARIAFWCIAIAGGVSMLYELAWTRLLTLSIGGTVHSFSTMLVSFIAGIALGSALAGRLLRRPRNALVFFGLCEVGIALAILLPLRWYERLPFAVHRMGGWLAHGPETYSLYLALLVALSAAVMAVPTTLIGAALPLASRVCVDRLDVLGRRVGNVFSANTIGTVGGAVVTGFLLLPWLGIESTLLLGSTVSGLLGVALLWSWRPRPSGRPGRALLDALRPAPPAEGAALWPAAAVLVAAAAGGALLAPRWNPGLMQQALYRWGTGTFASWDYFKSQTANSKFLYLRDGADGTIAVQERNPANLVIRVNGKPDASTISDMPTQLMVAHLPMLFHPHPRTAMVVGLGSGATASAVLHHPGVQADVAEISPEIVQAARHFAAWNARVLDNPRMSLRIVDAREFLLLTPKRYDVIVSEPTNVWVPGVANLFTREFYDVARSRLEPGGLFAQWLHAYMADPLMVASVVSTIHRTFPYVTAWLVSDGDLILLAGDARPAFDPDRFAARLAALRPTLDVPQEEHPNRLVLFQDPVLFLSHQIGTGEEVTLAWPAGTAPLYSDRRPRLEFQASRAQFNGTHYAVRDHVDGRVVRLGTEPLFVEEYLRVHPLDAAGRMRLAGQLGLLGASFRHVRDSIAAQFVMEGTDRPDLLMSLSDGTVASLTVARRLGELIDAGKADAAACEGYLAAQRSVFKDARSLFGRPAADGMEARVARCIEALPQHGLSLRAQLAAALADAGADEAALVRIRQLDADGSLNRLDRREAASMLLTGAVILLARGSYDDARPYAERAHALDAGSAAAARMVVALRSPRVADARQEPARAALAP